MPEEIRRADYRPPAWLVDAVDLTFELDANDTRVSSRLQVRRNGAAQAPTGPLILDGQQLRLERVQVDGRVLAGNEYLVDDNFLTIFDVPDQALVECVTRTDPAANTALEGLYTSGGMFCTQCEAEGFRRITYYPDRPDVMASFRTRIIADDERYPVLLSNGNKVDETRLADGRRQVTWEDPHRKPSYLFALVAGDLERITDSFTTASGRAVRLEIYSEAHNIDKCAFAMDSLKRAMDWDERVYGREYDLDIFMIVAVDHFNMGAMENKGLNIFNTSCVLASPDTTTDAGYQRVEGVVAHEYFHNWSGNRVTCRDWFQLSLKEGFTVYRDAMFSSDAGSRTVKRIADVNFLRSVQFAEDAGPMAHPIRPDAYIEINNFYTTTVYEKGAEVVGMLATLLGPQRFRAGSDLYFQRHDGQAVTTDDFVAAMEDANDISLAQFRLWYAQAGTPRVSVNSRYDAEARQLHLTIEQHCAPTPGQVDKAPLHIPLAFGLLDADGREISTEVSIDGDVEVQNPAADGTLVAHLRTARHELSVGGVSTPPRVSMLRGFSAPVQLHYPREDDELAFLARHDADGFARWDALQSLHARQLLAAAPGADAVDRVRVLVADLLQQALGAPHDGEARALLAAMLRLPDIEYLGELQAATGSAINVALLGAALDTCALELAEALHEQWRQVYLDNRPRGAYVPSGAEIARRSLQACALGYLVLVAPDAAALLREQYDRADNMTDRLAALRACVDSERAELAPLRDELLAEFYTRFADEALVVDLWLTTQVASVSYGSAQRARALLTHPAFSLTNPNKVRAVVGGFASRNPRRFHAVDGSGYAFLADMVIQLNRINPQVAARMLQPLSRWRRFGAEAQTLMRAQLQRVVAQPHLSNDVFEVASKSLAD